MGTRDPSAWLAAPEGIAMLRELGFDAVRGYNHGLAWEAARMLSERFGTIARGGGSQRRQHGHDSLAAAPRDRRRDDATRLRDALLFEDRIEVQLHAGRGRLWVRVSAQVYNEMNDMERLAEAIAARNPER